MVDDHFQSVHDTITPNLVEVVTPKIPNLECVNDLKAQDSYAIKKRTMSRKRLKRLNRIGNVMLNVLRNTALDNNIKVRSDAYVLFSSLVDVDVLSALKVNISIVQEIIKLDKKNRFSLWNDASEDWWIRANYGHSSNIAYLISPMKLLSPISFSTVEKYDYCIHGTSRNRWSKIQKKGINKMGSSFCSFFNHEYKPKSIIPGMLSECEILIYINLSDAVRDGIIFYSNYNGVLLSSGIDGWISKKYFNKVEYHGIDILPKEKVDSFINFRNQI